MNVQAALNAAVKAAASGLDSEAGNHPQYLTFVCAGEEYGVEILRVTEIKGWDGVTRVPYTPKFLLGVMNLRGVIVPVIDLRLRFGLPPRPVTSAVVIVVRIETPRGDKTAGIVVDAVSEVYGIAADDIKPTPEIGATPDHACVLGLASVDNKMVMLLDIDKLVASCIEAPEVERRT
jgi:purine-binding chemotaxis protein CheW